MTDTQDNILLIVNIPVPLPSADFRYVKFNRIAHRYKTYLLTY